jgi:RNA polymerase sigma-70 factor, ECF subfamily
VDVLTATATLTDEDVVRRVKEGDTALFEVLMRRYNQRIYRVARAVTKNEAEAEDVMQQAYVNAFVHLDQFEERAQFSTWLTRIAIHEALARRRRQRPTEQMPTERDEDRMETLAASGPDPEQQAYAGELGRLLEASVDTLPEPYRLVFMLRDVDGMSTAETAEGLGLGTEAVKTRLHRARAMLRRDLYSRVGAETARAFQFHLSRCDRVVAAVFARIR